jgi:hypothetical protein
MRTADWRDFLAPRTAQFTTIAVADFTAAGERLFHRDVVGRFQVLPADCPLPHRPR